MSWNEYANLKLPYCWKKNTVLTNPLYTNPVIFFEAILDSLSDLVIIFWLLPPIRHVLFAFPKKLMKYLFNYFHKKG